MNETAGKILIDGREPTDGMEIPGLGKVQVDRERRNIVLEAGPYTVAGTAHVPAGTDVVQYVTEAALAFVAITNATITYRPNPKLSFDAEFIMVNRRLIQSVTEAIASRESDDALPQVVDEGSLSRMRDQLLALRALGPTFLHTFGRYFWE